MRAQVLEKGQPPSEEFNKAGCTPGATRWQWGRGARAGLGGAGRGRREAWPGGGWEEGLGAHLRGPPPRPGTGCRETPSPRLSPDSLSPRYPARCDWTQRNGHSGSFQKRRNRLSRRRRRGIYSYLQISTSIYTACRRVLGSYTLQLPAGPGDVAVSRRTINITSFRREPRTLALAVRTRGPRGRGVTRGGPGARGPGNQVLGQLWGWRMEAPRLGGPGRGPPVAPG